MSYLAILSKEVLANSFVCRFGYFIFVGRLAGRPAGPRPGCRSRFFSRGFVVVAFFVFFVYRKRIIFAKNTKKTKKKASGPEGTDRTHREAF